MFYRSLFTNAFTACALFSGEIALADSFNISNDDSSAYSLINSLGEPLNAGNAILGTFSSGTWSYDVTEQLHQRVDKYTGRAKWRRR